MSTNGYAYTSLSTNDSHEPAPITPSRLRTLTHTIYTPIKQFFRTNYGLLLVIASQGCLAMVNVAVKKLNSIDPPVPILELILIRMGITWLFSIGLMHYNHIEHPFIGPKGVRLLLLSRGLGGFLGIFGVYSALQWISLSDATVLTFLAPLTTAMAGSIFLKEKFVKSQAIAGVLSLLGVILIARPVALFGHIPETVDEVVGIELDEPVPPLKLEGADTPDRRLLAVGVSLIGVLGSTIAYTCIRAIGKRAHALHSLVSFSSQSVIAATIGMIITRTAFIFPTKPLWGLLLLEIGVLGFTAQVLLTMGLQHEQAGRATMAIYTQIVWASILEKLYFQSSPSLLSVVGTVIIIGAAVYVALTKEKMPEEEEGQKELNLQGVVVALERLDRVDEAVGLEEGLLGVGGGVDEGLEKEGKREGT